VLDGVEVRSVREPFIQVPRPEDRLGEGRNRSLRGLRVLEVGHVLALPLAGSLLGALGASVTKLEDIKRTDMYRRRGPYIDGVEGLDRAAYFALANHSKDSVTTDAEADPDALARLLGQTDVVMENVGIRRSTKLGISASAINQSHPELLAVSSSGFGHEGPHSAYRAYAYNLQTSCGLVYLTRNEAGERAELVLAWGDLISAYALATIVAAWAVGPAGNTGAAVDFAMADLITARFNEFIAAASINPASDAEFDRANETYPYAPSGVYETTDGWIAISVDGDAQFEHLCGTLANATPLQDTRFSTSAGRFAARRELDSALAEAIAARERHELAHALRAAGIIAEPLLPPDQMLDDNHLSQRGFFATVDHPEWGHRHLIGIPWRAAGEQPIPLRAPPLFAALEPKVAPLVPT
jgi:crotonobetainyl-CoA:carnitine CoA-transferase CaiB-like acyl-CoA transferase